MPSSPAWRNSTRTKCRRLLAERRLDLLAFPDPFSPPSSPPKAGHRPPHRHPRPPALHLVTAACPAPVPWLL